MLTLLPLFLLDCPYRTPLTPAVWSIMVVITRNLSRPPSPHRSQGRIQEFLRTYLSFHSSPYKSLDRCIQHFRSVAKAFGPTDAGALSEVAGLRYYNASSTRLYKFAEELPAAVACISVSPKSPLTIFGLSNKIGDIYTMLNRGSNDLYSDVAVERRDFVFSRRNSVAFVRLLACLNLPDRRLRILHETLSSLPTEVRCAMPNIVESTRFIVGYPADRLVRSLSNHRDGQTAIAARGVFGLATLAWLQQSFSIPSNDNLDGISRVLRVTFPHARPLIRFMADEQNILANGTCIVALCVLYDLEATAGAKGWSPTSYWAHLHTLALLSTLSSHVESTVASVTEEFVRTWEELEKTAECPDPSWSFYTWERNRIVVEFLRPLYKALKASRGPALVVVVGRSGEES
ncbi:hypothetical protein OF83DRAFT_258776 [Amylostereum chailletii]|nr:hypothetical protein OF83DRAFT_258776 [Amylostereum chailletii]